MVFSLESLPKPTREEMVAIKRIAQINPEDLDSRELWILENFSEGDDDD